VGNHDAGRLVSTCSFNVLGSYSLADDVGMAVHRFDYCSICDGRDRARVGTASIS
jgi:hypothetical protein